MAIALLRTGVVKNGWLPLLTVCLCLRAEVPHLARVDDHIYRGKQPNEQGFAGLAHMGIKTVLDLRGGRFHEPRERKQVEAAGMRYISIRLSGIWAPKDEQIAKILGTLEDPKLWPIFVHCWRGDDRVGLVIACYRMAHDHWTNEQAFAEARRLGLNRFEIFLRRYIHKFDPARVGAAAGTAVRPTPASAQDALLPQLRVTDVPAVPGGPARARAPGERPEGVANSKMVSRFCR